MIQVFLVAELIILGFCCLNSLVAAIETAEDISDFFALFIGGGIGLWLRFHKEVLKIIYLLLVD